MFDVDNVLHERFPKIQNKPWLRKPLQTTLRHLLHEDEFRGFEERFPHLKGIEFVEQVLEYFNLRVEVNQREYERIPAHGRVVIFANHPVGSLDGLALLKLVHDIRPDVRIVANDILMQLEPMHKLLLPVDNTGGKTVKENLREIDKWLHQDGVVIFFPAGEVSRLKPSGIKDGAWHKGFLQFAARNRAPLIPIHVNARNSAMFYGTSMLYKPLSTLLLVQEMFNLEDGKIKLTIGEQIPYESYQSTQHLTVKMRVKLLYKHLYRIGKGKSGLFQTEAPIARPESRTVLRKELENSEKLGETPDGKTIWLYSSSEDSPVLREIGRLREVAFRAVGEGTGKRRDLDKFDQHYWHLILWDPGEQEIVGAYRFADTAKLMKEYGEDAIYTCSLFYFDREMTPYLDKGLELGRSFVQPRYWGRRCLDYLWFGIGAFLAKNPQYRYLFGPVTISNALPDTAKALLIYFYNLYFPSQKPLAASKRPFRLSEDQVYELTSHFSGNDYSRDFKKLKHLLDNLGCAIPTLYKQYAELCDPSGVQFIDFNVDPDFADCIDGLVLVDIHTLKPQKRDRYIRVHMDADQAG
ncbi:lysophospholipid acyltransferase family protein [Parasalinivibrio latis]|uniref:lysophospholipid acyltransferase family protein n=1 Tax=Parasalinivibrio latis TaxID=2952610 RepID=UPI0030E52ACD